MSAQGYDNSNSKTHFFHHADDNAPGTTLKGKLERRRRIEDLDEERRLQQELNECYR